jgi:hypothetical protein
LLQNSSLNAPIIENTSTVAIKQGGPDEGVNSGVVETVDNMVNHSLFLLTKVSPQGEMVKESGILIIIL